MPAKQLRISSFLCYIFLLFSSQTLHFRNHFLLQFQCSNLIFSVSIGFLKNIFSNKKVIHHFANHFYNSYLYQISFFRTFTYRIYCGLGYKHESSQVQYRNALSVKILAKISPSGSAAMIRSAAANQDAERDKDMIPRL